MSVLGAGGARPTPICIICIGRVDASNAGNDATPRATNYRTVGAGVGIGRHTAMSTTDVVCVAAVQNERQPRNTATIRPEALRDMSAEQERALREAAVAVGVFG